MKTAACIAIAPLALSTLAVVALGAYGGTRILEDAPLMASFIWLATIIGGAFGAEGIHRLWEFIESSDPETGRYLAGRIHRRVRNLAANTRDRR